ncbi:MAG: response regulator [Bacteroidota bacterium]|nr:MAG: response regulator [Bacteroidota bacterium]
MRPEYTVLESRNLDELKTQMQKSRPKLLILDVSLLNGQITHMRQIREWEKHRIHYVPVIATTSLSPDEAARYCRESGMDDFISKPVKAATLENILDTWIPVHTKTQETARSANQEPSRILNAWRSRCNRKKTIPTFYALHPRSLARLSEGALYPFCESRYAAFTRCGKNCRAWPNSVVFHGLKNSPANSLLCKIIRRKKVVRFCRN